MDTRRVARDLCETDLRRVIQADYGQVGERRVKAGTGEHFLGGYE
jgi:hypothetical protein